MFSLHIILRLCRYVKWMMYWIVFALFTSVETFSDFFFSFWFPFYYEIKIVFLIWLLSPATKGSSLLYRKFVHPQLLSREQKIDEMIVAAQTRSYDTAMQLGQRSVRYVTGLIMDQAVRAPAIMQDIMTGTASSATNTQQQRFEPGTISEINDENTAPIIELSEDEVAEGVHIALNDEEDDRMDATDGLSDESSRASKVTRRRKKNPVDFTFSSGGESDEEFHPAPSTSSKTTKTGKTVSRKGPARTASSRTARKTKQ